MTQEDIMAKCMKKAELVAQREELDQMYDMGKNSGGQEFHLFLKLQEVINAAGSNSSKFIQQEYDQAKAQSFFNDIANQMKSIVGDQEESIKTIIEAQNYIKQKACILKPEEIIMAINQLTKDLDMEIDLKLLQTKFESASTEKDKIYQQKSVKLNDITVEIKQHEQQISKYHNEIENNLKPQEIAFDLTMRESNYKLKQLTKQIKSFEEKQIHAKKDYESMKSRKERQHQKQLNFVNLNVIYSQMKELQSHMDMRQQKIDKLEKDKLNIKQQYEMSFQILQAKKKEARNLQNIYDPLNATGGSLQSSSQNSHTESSLEDE